MPFKQNLVYLSISICLILTLVSALAPSPEYAIKAANTNQSYLLQGIQLFQKKDYKAATTYFDAACKANSKDPQAFYYKALNYHYMNNLAQAKVLYRTVVESFPGTPEANYSLRALLQLDPAYARSKMPKRATPSISTSSVRSSSGFSSDYDSLPNEATIDFTSYGGSPIVTVYINNRPINMILDTGAPSVLIGKNQLLAAGLSGPQGNPQGRAGGATSGATVASWQMNADISLGSINRRNFPVSVIENNPSPPLIGYEFFRDYKYTIDNASSRVYFKKKVRGGDSYSSQSSGGYAVPFTVEGDGSNNKIVVNVEVNGKPYPMWFDTGNSASAISMNPQDVKALGLQIPETVQAQSFSGITGSGMSIVFPVDRVKLGPIERYNVDVSVNVQSSRSRPLLGTKFYEGWQYTIDNDNKVLRFLRR